METPSSTRRITRSQALAAACNSNNIPMSRKIEECEKSVSKSRQKTGKQQDRSALIDITNDSPIIGLAMGSLETPSSTMSKKRINGQAKHMTPGSGEALLRGQVKTLLQKVEEEAELSKLSLESRPFLHLGGNGSANSNGLASVTLSPVEEKFMISQMINEMLDGKKQEDLESEKSLITRSLLLDFSEKSEASDSSGCSSVLTYQEGESEGREKLSADDDDASIWSIQVNASTRDEEEEEEDEEGPEEVNEDGENDDEYYEDGEEVEADDGGLVDELCEGICKINVNCETTMTKFTGKHTRFVYNSDDELEGEEECDDGESESIVSMGILRLKGLPTPEGKHLRFPEDLEED
ncbi:unnamed protein product [Ilex paraguariensis]|uniref:Uncharacterized protein n=1 Tax=Ilex paraguariensis TaxID=185542 RepID=A0ABC8SIR4_9AQUA